MSDAPRNQTLPVRDHAIEAMAEPMRNLLGGDWVKYKGGEGLAALALRALLPIIAGELRDAAERMHVEGADQTYMDDAFESAAALIEERFGEDHG